MTNEELRRTIQTVRQQYAVGSVREVADAALTLLAENETLKLFLDGALAQLNKEKHQ